MASTTDQSTEQQDRSGIYAAIVAFGIMLSRLSGLVRETVLANFLGTSTIFSDAFIAALQVPKTLQNLLGEGSLAASFVPVYSELLEEDEEHANRVAASVLGLLIAATTAGVLLIMALARPLIDVFGRGFTPEVKELAVPLLRTMAPGIGFIVIAAWCLGVLNSHRKFFLSYVAPMLWNLSIIGAVAFTALQTNDQYTLVDAAAWGVVIGGIAQFGVQLPAVLKITGRLSPKIFFDKSVRDIVGRFVPAVASRGAVTLATFGDMFMASFLAGGALSILSRSQVLYLMPISVFAMSVAAADLPDLSRERGRVGEARRRIDAGLDRISFFLCYSTVVLTVGAYSLAEFVYVRGESSSDDGIAIAITLAVFGLGLWASGQSRLLTSAAFAVGDVRGPAIITMIRIGVAFGLGALLMFQFDRFEVISGEFVRLDELPAWKPLPEDVREAGVGIPHLGAVGLAIGATIAAWLELFLLRRRLLATFGGLGLWASAKKLIGPTIVSAVVLAGALALFDFLPWRLGTIVGVAIAGSVYCAMAWGAGDRTAREVWSAISRRIGR